MSGLHNEPRASHLQFLFFSVLTDLLHCNDTIRGVGSDKEENPWHVSMSAKLRSTGNFIPMSSLHTSESDFATLPHQWLSAFDVEAGVWGAVFRACQLLFLDKTWENLFVCGSGVAKLRLCMYAPLTWCVVSIGGSTKHLHTTLS